MRTLSVNTTESVLYLNADFMHEHKESLIHMIAVHIHVESQVNSRVINATVIYSCIIEKTGIEHFKLAPTLQGNYHQVCYLQSNYHLDFYDCTL